MTVAAPKATARSAGLLAGPRQSEELPPITRRKITSPAFCKTSQDPATDFQSKLRPNHVIVMWMGQLHSRPMVRRTGFIAQETHRIVHMPGCA